jgi:hypothetical protein
MRYNNNENFKGLIGTELDGFVVLYNIMGTVKINKF